MMTGESRGFSQVVAGFLSFNEEVRMPLVLAQGSPISIRVARESWALLSSQGREIGLQDALRGESLGLSRVVAGNPRFL